MKSEPSILLCESRFNPQVLIYIDLHWELFAIVQALTKLFYKFRVCPYPCFPEKLHLLYLFPVHLSCCWTLLTLQNPLSDFLFFSSSAGSPPTQFLLVSLIISPPLDLLPYPEWVMWWYCGTAPDSPPSLPLCSEAVDVQGGFGFPSSKTASPDALIIFIFILSWSSPCKYSQPSFYCYRSLERETLKGHTIPGKACSLWLGEPSY